MKSIPLTQSQSTTIDDGDYGSMSSDKWQLHNGYASRRNSQGKRLYMHREIMGNPVGMEVDHIDGDRLNNRRENLRVCTKAENRRNLGLRSNNSTGYKGVCFRKDVRKWQAQISVDSRAVFLGNFDTPEAAARAYDVAAKKHYGEFARTNA